MTDKIEKAKFHLEAEEYNKAEKLFSDVFDQSDKNSEALIGLTLSKIYQGNIKGAEAYLKRLELDDIDRERRKELKEELLKASEKCIDKKLSTLREKANELSKRPALDGQISSVKQLSDTTDHMSNINDAAEDFEKIFSIAQKSLELDLHDEKETAFRLLNLYDKVFKNIRETPQMQGKTLISAKNLASLKSQRQNIKQKAGDKASSITSDPSDSSGCLVLLVALSSLFTISLVIIL